MSPNLWDYTETKKLQIQWMFKNLIKKKTKPTNSNMKHFKIEFENMYICMCVKISKTNHRHYDMWAQQQQQQQPQVLQLQLETGLNMYSTL